MFKFISWVFKATSRHYKEIRTYEKGLKGRIFTLIYTLLLVLLTIGLEYWIYSLIMRGEEFIVIFFVGLLTLAFVATAIDFCSTFCYVGFKNAFVGVVITTAKLIEKANKKRKNKKLNNAKESEEVVVMENDNKDETLNTPLNNNQDNSDSSLQNEKTYKIFDICFAVIQGVLAVGMVASLILLPVFMVNS